MNPIHRRGAQRSTEDLGAPLRPSVVIPILCLLLAGPASADQACAGRTDYRAGVGRADVTGPAGGVAMMGYAMPWQTTGGIHTRLFARAVVVESPCNGRRLAFVSVDVGLLTQAVQQAVLARLRERFGERYDAGAVILSATHTHSGPGGYSHYVLYNLPTLGYSAASFAAVRDGIVEAIAAADAGLAPARLRLAVGALRGAAINRSLPAYERNPAAERARYGDDLTDVTMTVLRVDAADGTPRGVVSWFPVHATSMGNDNHLISGDNKGYAAQRFERAMAGGTPPFVAAFAQSHEGDTSPNVFGGTDGGGADDFASTALSGEKQFAAALALWREAAIELSGPVDSRLTYVEMDAVAVAPEFADGQPRHTCPAAIGVSMLAGAEDGPGVGWEGVGCAPPATLVERALCAATASECQGAKPIAVEMGRRDPPWSPDVLPLQVARIGELAIVAAPFELSTMSGRRLLDTVRDTLAPAGVRWAVVAGLANAYCGYITTPEEYAAQHYEGASTHFGPWSLGALRQTVAELAAALRDGRPAAPGPAPRDPDPEPGSLQPPVLFDAVPLGAAIGAVSHDAAPAYQRGETARASFWGGHPQHDLQRGDTFLEIQRRAGGDWQTVAVDHDWETRYRWQRSYCLPTLQCSLVTIEWDIPADATPGTYRIRHDGHWKPLPTRVVEPYAALSREFEVR